jgi:hypothetical protein
VDGAVLSTIIVIIYFILSLVKGLRELGKQNPPKQEEAEEPIVVIRSKPVKTKPKRKQLQQETVSNVYEMEYDLPKRQALSKKLPPQGEGSRFDTAPGTLDAAKVVVPMIDPTVKPELESMTGIYEQESTLTPKSSPPLSLNIVDWFAKPEGLCRAVILAEILNRPAWNSKAEQ